MPRTLSLFIKTWALGLTAWALVYTKEVPVAFAQSVIETDCSEDLDQPGTTYLLNTNTSGDCIIAADNIILDGQNLYEVNGRVWIPYNLPDPIDFTVRNLSVTGLYGYVMTWSPSGAGGDVVIENSTVGGFARAHLGSLVVTDSEIGGNLRATEDILITNSSVSFTRSYTGDITIESSEVGDGDYGASASAGNITISDSTILGTTFAFGVLDVIDSTTSIFTAGRGGVNIENSTVTGRTRTHASSGADISILNSTVALVEAFNDGVCTITDSSVNGDAACPNLTLTDNPPSLIVTPLDLSLDYGDSFNPFSGISADDIKDGDLSDGIVVVGEVGQEGGVFNLLYSVTDSGTVLTWNGVATSSGPSTATTTRTVTRDEKPIQSTSVGVHKDRKEKQAAQEALPNDATALIDTLRTTLNEPGSTNDPEALKQIIDLVRQLIIALLELMAAGGKVR